MRGCLSAETLKLRKKPAAWIIAALLALTLVVFGYLITYLFVVREVGGPVDDGGDFLPNLLPAQYVANTLASLAVFGGAFALVLGALVSGSEYEFGTVKTIAMQRPSRLLLAAGQLAAVAIAVLVLSLLCLSTGLATSLTIAAVEGATAALPPAGVMLAGIAVLWLVLMLWAALGMLLSVAFRSAGMAIGLGLVYVLLVEQMVVSLPLPESISGVLDTTMVGPNTLVLAQALGDLNLGNLAVQSIAPAQALAVLAAYLATALAAAAAVFVRRDIT